MLQPTQDKLDQLILEEKKRVALEFFSEAWAAAIDEGIEPSILAETAMFTAISRLSEEASEKAASDLVEQLPQRFECGDFLANRSLQ
ncbi:hypothetical protein ACFQ14_04890 [Pseudahrensia aquimaris]|uniref:Uncharacterized protein n=1 Tax=Pseudahrensia aquimaris TaxID=744461 RepID=A0ABW3FBC0_9HYPH